MPHATIVNPRGTYGDTASFPRNEESFQASAAIAAKAVVSIGTDGRVATAATDGTASLVVGVAKDAAASGAQVQVVTNGYVAAVPVDGAVAAGGILKRSATTAGRLATTASPAAGEAIAVALAASASNVATVWVAKSL